MVLHNNWFVQIVEWIVEFVLGRTNGGDNMVIIPADDPRFKYVGRWQLQDDNDDDDDGMVVAKADWPCSQLQFQLKMSDTTSSTSTTSATSSFEEGGGGGGGGGEGAPPPKLIGLRLNLLRVRVHVEVVAVTTTTSEDGEDGDSGTSKSSSSSSTTKTTILQGPAFGGGGFWKNQEKTYNILLPRPHAAAATSTTTTTTHYKVKMTKLTQAAPSGNGLGKHFTSVLQFYGIELPDEEEDDDDDDDDSDLRLIDSNDSDTTQQQQRRTMAVIGASDTAGYCVDGTRDDTRDAQMLGAYKYDNCHETSHSLLSRKLNAEQIDSVQGMAGIGLTQNAFAKQPYLLGKFTMFDYYPRTLQTVDDNKQNNKWQQFPINQRRPAPPDLVLVSLGGNDFNHQGTKIPSDDTFNQAYSNFLHDIIQPYITTTTSSSQQPQSQLPITTIVSICGQGDPTETSRDPDNDRCRPCPHVEQAVEAYRSNNTNNTNNVVRVEYIFIPCDGSVVTGIDDIGCDGHKNRIGQQRVANFLEPKLRHIMNWHDNNSDDNDDENQHNHQNRIFTNETTTARTRIDSNNNIGGVEITTRSATNSGTTAAGGVAVVEQEAVINSSSTSAVLAIVSLVLLASAAMFVARRVVMSIRSSSSSSTAPISYSLASVVDKDIDIDTDDDDEESVGSGNCNV